MQSKHAIAKTGELKDGQMKSVELEGRSVLLVRHQGRFFACSATCPHHGAPLVEGSLHEGRARCPWHQAVFDVMTGKLLEPPALDGLETFEVSIEGEEVIVTIPEPPIPSEHHGTAKAHSAKGQKTFVILGAGAAGMAAAETLRAEGFAGRICMIAREKHLPYDRTDLSKNYLSKPSAEPPSVRGAGFYAAQGVDVVTECEVAEVDVSQKRISFESGDSMSYDRILLATGASPRHLGVAGASLQGILPLRTLDDCETLRAAVSECQEVVVVGASFIGMEVCAALLNRKRKVTVVAPDAVPFERTLGGEIGRMYQRVHEEKGATFRLGKRVKRFLGDRILQAVELDDGERLETTLAVLGVGVRPATEYLRGIVTNKDGSVPVDACLRAAEDVWAAGDIASFPDWRTSKPIRIEHWRVAQQHGRVAAMNMAGKTVPYRGVPFFWTNQFMVITDYIGYCPDWDEIVFDGDLAGKSFLAYYVKDGRVLAVAGSGQERGCCVAADLLAAPDPSPLDAFQAELNQRCDALTAR